MDCCSLRIIKDQVYGKELLPKVAHYDMMADPFRCDFSKHLTVGQLGNALLNAADFHSDDREFGMNYLHTIHRTWVLSRLCIELEAMPRAYDPFSSRPGATVR